MTPVYTVKLGINIEKTNVEAYKIDSLPLEIYGIVLAVFSPQDWLMRVRFLEKTFLLVNISLEMLLGMFFLSLGNTNVKFAKLGKLTLRSHNIVKALLTTGRVEFIDKREFAKTDLNENTEIFVIYVTILDISTVMPIHLSRTRQVQGSNKSIFTVL